MTVRRAAVLGNGLLALHACEILASLDGWSLTTIVVNSMEPSWDLKVSDVAHERWPDVEVVRSGAWEELLGGDFDLVLSVLYDRIIGQSLIDEAGLVLNCHLGRLPQYRGVRPANWALKNGERLHGVTIHMVTSKVDSGPVVGEALFPIWPLHDEVRDVWTRSRSYATQLLSDVLRSIDHLTPVEQDEAHATTYFRSQDGLLGDRIDWTRSRSREAGRMPGIGQP